MGFGADGLEGDVGAVAAGLEEFFVVRMERYFKCRGLVMLTISVGFMVGTAQKLLVKRPTQRKVVFFASSGRVALISSAAWSLPCVVISTSDVFAGTILKTYIHVRHIVFFAPELLPRRQSMQDQVLESVDLVRRSSNINQLLSLLLRSCHDSDLHHVLEEVGHTENSIGILCTGVSILLRQIIQLDIAIP